MQFFTSRQFYTSRYVGNNCFRSRLHSLRASRRPLTSAVTAVLLAGSLNTTAQTESAFEELVVSASRIPQSLREIGTSVSVLNKEDIEQRGFLTVPELLRTQTSVAGSNNGGTGKTTSIRIRGEEGFRTMVLLDGIDISDTSGPQVSPRLEHILSADIERIEILRGPQGLSYGADAGGVINIQTASPGEGFGGGFGAEFGRYGTQQLSGHLGASGERGNFAVSATSFETDGFNTRTLDTELRDHDGYDNTTVHAKGGWNLTDQLRLEGVVRSVDSDNDFDSCGFPTIDDCTGDFSQDNQRVALVANYGQFFHELSYNNSDIERDSFTNGSFAFGSEGSIERLSYLGRFQASDKHQFVYGIDEETESIDDGNVDRDRGQTGVYAEYQGRISELISVSAGVRNDDNDDFGSFTSYRLSGAYITPLAGGELKVKAAYGTGFRAPSLFEINYNNGPFAFPPASGTSLSEETSAGYDLGVAWASSNGTLVELTWFDQDVEDAITFDLAAFSGYVQDSGTSNSSGVEFSIDTPLTNNLRLYGNYTFNEAELPDGSPRVRRPEQLANLSLVYAGLGDRLQLSGSARLAMDAIEFDGSAIDDYTVVDISASYALSKQFTVFGRLENAFDEDYEEVPTYNTAGQSLYAGVRYEF